MAATLAARRRAEIVSKIDSLTSEWAHWVQVTQEESTGLRRHHSQVRRIVASLQGLTEAVSGRVGDATADVLAEALHWEEDVLAAHAIWEVFRAKLVLRRDNLFRDALAPCDDLAWECYRPAMTALAPRPDAKTPPLVYFSSTWSPFAQSRDRTFANEVRAARGTGGALADDTYQRVMSRLPVSLVGLPWYQSSYLPGAILIAHEIGHVVEWDFDLGAGIRAALAGAGLQFPDVWAGWASEVFADTYGALAMGPAFGGALIDLLAASRDVVTAEARRGGAYPTRALRVELTLRVLQQTGHDAAAARLRGVWEATYGAITAMADFLTDADTVIPALLAATFNGVRLRDVITAPGTDQAARQVAQWTVDNHVKLRGVADVRVLFSAAQWLQEEQHPQRGSAFAILRAHAARQGGHQFRFRGQPVADVSQVEQAMRDDEACDIATGRELRDFLRAGIS